tara:strand:+ start:693 stop:971 length:279 start_codon:yes stop_codon:yes gene_type:complete
MSKKFVLFKNKNKTAEKQPDMTGNIEDENGNKTHYLSGWFRTPNGGGARFISGEITSVAERAKYKKENSTATSGMEFSEPTATAVPEDDLPF